MQVNLKSTGELLFMVPWIGQDAAPWREGYARVGRTVPRTRKGKAFEEFIVRTSNLAKTRVEKYHARNARR